MKEVEFRGKRKDNNEWVYGSLIVFNSSYYIIESCCEAEILNNSYKKYEVQPETVGQYINRRDCDDKGEKLYEGDILYDEINEEYCYIDFDDVISKYSLEYNGESVDIEGLNGMTKVGNIYDNPDLE